LYALRAFCSELEEIADSKASRSFKQRLLLNWRTEIFWLYDGRPQHALAHALSQAIQLYDLRCDDFLMIIEGMQMDVRTDIQAPSLAELDRYCECAAVAVGRLALRICGEETPAGERIAAELGRALQLTNILRDLAKDAARNRLYLPRELLEAHCIFETSPSSVLARRALSDVCRDLARRAKGHYLAAERAIAACPRRRVRPAAMIFGVYRMLLHELLERPWTDPDEPVHISGWRKLALAVRHELAGR
jgi:phytoene synthase